MHERDLNSNSVFLTLTYRDEALPEHSSLTVKHLQLFMKQVRNRLGKCRFFACGEYGALMKRPHYHVLLFGQDFPDKVFFRTINGSPAYVSELLDLCWPHGFSLIGAVNFASACYVARYIVKKALGPAAREHYRRVDKETGEIYQLKPEFTVMSRRPGIGAGWFEKYKDEVYSSRGNSIVMGGREMRPPRFYDGLLEVRDVARFERMKRQRRLEAKKHEADGTPERLRVRAEVEQSKVQLLKRRFEDGVA